MAELPLGLWIIFIGIGMPLFILVALTIRFALFWEAAREAAQTACQCQTFFANPAFPSNALSAINTANTVATNVVSSFNGLTVTAVNLYIVIVPVNNPGSTQTLGPYGVGACPPGIIIDTDQNMYQIKVLLNGQIQPVLTMPGGLSNVAIPGLTQAVTVSASQTRVFDNATGLNY